MSALISLSFCYLSSCSLVFRASCNCLLRDNSGSIILLNSGRLSITFGITSITRSVRAISSFIERIPSNWASSSFRSGFSSLCNASTLKTQSWLAVMSPVLLEGPSIALPPLPLLDTIFWITSLF